ncbi:hypothetical protein ASPCAL08314 [Aspergillus calidoustus]|uniref:Uncharacterized protein n=1 Tax=Aspergillus calidoustus TaxID=454130 RepID=A0A0U5GR81_ASPCI|nr:hypothetical protein ASPCAL08314 [Aspergillus calidoustus]
MVSPFCWGCLTPLRQTSRTILPSPSAAVSRGPAFHTSAALQFMGRASQGGKKGSTVLKFRQPASSTMKKKKKFVEKARPPPVGERKALRKRIVLSNPNALEVEGLQELSEETMVDSRLRGTVLALPVPMLDQLRAVQAFKPKQGWSIFRRPCTVLRRETLELGRFFDGVTGDTEGGGAVIKKIVGGARKSGKSVHLLQAMAMGFIKNTRISICYQQLRTAVRGESKFVRSERGHGRSAVPHRRCEQGGSFRAPCLSQPPYCSGR